MLFMKPSLLRHHRFTAASQRLLILSASAGAGLLAVSFSAQAAPSKGVRIAQTAPTGENSNAPAAKPDENPPGLTIPLGPDDSKNNGTPAAPPLDNTPVTPPPTLPVPDTTPTVPSIIGNVAEAEGEEVADVRIVGNRVVPATTILAQIRTQRGAAFSSRQAELDRTRIDQLGFFALVQVQVSPDLTDPKKTIATYIVTENRVVTGYRFEGSKVVKAADLQAALTSKVGVLLNSNIVQGDIATIKKLYRDKGFAAVVRSATQDDDGTLVFTVLEARVSEVRIVGLTKTSESLIRRQIRTKAGDVFNGIKVIQDVNRLADTQFFQDQTYRPDDDPNNPGSIIVTFLVKEKRTGQIGVGIGFDSRSKISGFLTISDNNLRGSGRRALASIETGSQRNLELSLGNPYVGDKNGSYDVSVYSRTIFRQPRLLERLSPGSSNTDTYSFQERRTGGRLNYSQPLDFDRKQTLVYGFRAERANLSQIDNQGNSSPVTVDGRELDSSGRVVAASFGIVRDRRDLRTDPSTGGRESLIVEQAFKPLGSSNSFTKFDLDLRRYIPLTRPEKLGAQPKVVVAGRLVFSRALNQLPAFEQYYIGGPDTVRGYDTDEQFGDNQAYGNLELRYRFNRQFQGVLFSDVGTAFGGNFSSSTGADVLFSVGVGVRVQTPIGPVRLDLGRGSNGVKTHFAIGPTF